MSSLLIVRELDSDRAHQEISPLLYHPAEFERGIAA
jgi:hypothetical protein